MNCPRKSHSHKTPPGKSKGVALITALLIVALATVAATSFATQQQLDIRRTGNLIDGDQAWAYAEGDEAYAKLILREDSKKNNATDDFTEQWAQPMTPIKLPGGYMVGNMTDAQSRLNLNNFFFANPGGGNPPTGNPNPPPAFAGAQGTQPDPTSLQRLQRLLTELQLDPNFAFAIADWIDTDINASGAYGAEDDYYSTLKNPYRTANQAMASVSELRLVKGFNEKAYQRIAPFVTALPAHTAINVNTAPAQVLATLANMDVKAALALVKLRQENPWKDTADFEADLSTVAQVPGGTTVGDIDVTSQYFDVNIDTRIGYGRASLTSLLSREAQGGTNQGEIKTIRRAQGVL